MKLSSSAALQAMLAIAFLAGCAAYQAHEAHQRHLTVAPDPVPCADGTPGACLRVTDAEGDSWITRPDEIEGFAYEPGFTYELLVEEPSQVAEMESASRRLKLVRVLSREASGAPRQALPEDLGRPRWVLSAVAPSGHPEAAWAASGITARFDVWGGRLSGFAGCNNYSAGLSVAGDRIDIAPPVSTRKACPSETVMALEAEYLERIARASAFEVTDDRLELSLTDGSGMAFRRAGR
jgi:heat shock protein HslJ